MTKDMTSGNPVKLIVLFSIPLLIGNIFQQFYSMVDTVIVGRYLGVDALAAVGSTSSMFFLINGFVVGIASGFSILVAQWIKVAVIFLNKKIDDELIDKIETKISCKPLKNKTKLVR